MATERNIGTGRRKLLRNPLTDGVEVGKVPPHALDLEEAVLGALMLEKDALNDVIEVLKPESFYKNEHRLIYEAIVQLFNDSKPIDILTVTAFLRKAGTLDQVGGAYAVSRLTDRVASSANAEYHARIIAQKFIQRELIRVSGDIYNEAFEDTTDVLELLDKAESSLFSVAEGNLKKSYDSMSGLISQAIKNIETASQQEGNITGVPTGFHELDKVTAGWQKQDLLIVAARPAMGKTSFVLSMARNMAVDFNKAIAVFSLEMSSLQLVNRLIASETGLEADKLRKGTLSTTDWDHLHSSIKRLSQAPIFIDDTPSLSIFELRAKCRRLKAQHDLSIVLIDYLQLMTAGGDSKNGGNREQEISTISRSLKALAKELDIPVIALSQLSRQVENRGGSKRPQLSDLRESGAIEQDADMVMFLYRPEYYEFTESATGLPVEGLAELIIAKHRNGATGDVPLRFIKQLAKFTNYDDPGYTLAAPASVAGAGYGPLPVSDQFSGGSMTITRQSKMNTMTDDDLDPTDGTPF